MYEYQTVYNETLNYFNGNELATNVWISKYALKNPISGYDELTPDDMHRRMARGFERIEKKFVSKLTYGDIYELFKEFGKLIPQGSIMAMLGNPHSIGSLSNCIVLPKIYDSYGGIMQADQQLVQLMKRRCGVGLDISTLRPEGTKVTNAAVTSTGGVSFMHRFSNSTREVAQGGRRGAAMITCDIRYPDIEKFIKVKQDLTQVTGANISVKIRDDFMQAVLDKENYFLRFPVDYEFNTDTNPYELPILPVPFGKSVEAKRLWDTIIDCAWETAEPGVIFWDRQHWYSPSSVYPEFENISTNPCAEIAMGNDSCRLMALNTVTHVKNPFTKEAEFDFNGWYESCYRAMYLMDDLVELELEAIDRIIDKIKRDKEPDETKQVELQTWRNLYSTGFRGRRTGLGLTALADTLATLGYKYDSKEAFAVVEMIMEKKLSAELDAMVDMAKERGPFPAWNRALEAEMAEDPNTFFYMIKKKFPEKWIQMQKYGRRNISWSTLAPTGSLSLLAKIKDGFFGTTSGMEPLFALSHTRRKKITHSDKDARVDFVDALGDKWQEFKVYHEGYNAAVHELLLGKGDNSKPYYNGSTASEIDWIKRVELQSIIQEFTSHSISSTINLPKDVSKQEVSDIYFEAWRRGLKGITIYRDGCRDGVLITDGDVKLNEDLFKTHDAPKRPKVLPSDIYRVTVKGKEFLVIVGLYGSSPYEVFALENVFGGMSRSGHFVGETIKVKSGRYDLDIPDVISIEDFANQMTDEEAALARMISTALRHGANIKFIVEQLDKIEGSIVGFTKAIARVLRKYVPEQERARRAVCKDCGSSEIRFTEGCSVCISCGSSKCG